MCPWSLFGYNRVLCSIILEQTGCIPSPAKKKQNKSSAVVTTISPQMEHQDRGAWCFKTWSTYFNSCYFSQIDMYLLYRELHYINTFLYKHTMYFGHVSPSFPFLSLVPPSVPLLLLFQGGLFCVHVCVHVCMLVCIHLCLCVYVCVC